MRSVCKQSISFAPASAGSQPISSIACRRSKAALRLQTNTLQLRPTRGGLRVRSQATKNMLSGRNKKQDAKVLERATTPPPASSVASPAVFASALALFSLITWDVFGGSHWLESHVDLPTHHWVCATLDPETRRFAAGWLLSDSWIASGILGWWVCGATLVAQSGRKGVVLLSTALAAYFLGGGFLLSGDVLLVDFLKHIFKRLRPSTLHHTYSFPSGHTTAGKNAGVLRVGSGHAVQLCSKW